MSDTLFQSNGTKVQNHVEGSAESEPLFDSLEQQFPWSKRSLYRAIGETYTHEFLNERVTRTCLNTIEAENLIGNPVATAHRLFGRDSNTSMLYVTDLYQGERPGWATPDTFVIGETIHHQELGRPINPQMLEFKEYFFVAPKNDLETVYLVDTRDVNGSTVFSALVSGNQLVAVRRYTNFMTANVTGVLANWQSIYVMFARKAKRNDLVRRLFALSYIHELD